jgi:hypothetical protein
VDEDSAIDALVEQAPDISEDQLARLRAILNAAK